MIERREMNSELRAGFWTGSSSPLLYNFVDISDPELPHLVFGCTDRETLEQRVERSRNGPFEPLTVEFGGVVFHFALRGFEIDTFSRSEGSSAVYLAKLDLGDHGFLLQLVPPNSQTSSHCHVEKVEIFHRIFGKPILRLGRPTYSDGETLLRLRERYNVPKGVFHQVKTQDHHALTLLEVVGPNALGSDDYTFE